MRNTAGNFSGGARSLVGFFIIMELLIALPARARAAESPAGAAAALQGQSRFAAIEQAVRLKNYSQWKQLMAGRSIEKIVTAQNFGEYAQAWGASVQGDQALLNAFKKKYQAKSVCPFSKQISLR